MAGKSRAAAVPDSNKDTQPRLRATDAWFWLDGVCLLFRQVPNHGHLPHLTLVCLQQQDDPEDESAEADQQMEWKGNQRQERHNCEDRKADVENNQRRREKQALK